MITVLISDANEEKVQEILAQMLKQYGNADIDILKQENIVKIIKNDSTKDMTSLQDKLIALEESLLADKKGVLYKSLLEIIDKPLIEHMLERTEGNQLKAARILGINRNTLRAKIKRLGIEVRKWKIGV